MSLASIALILAQTTAAEAPAVPPAPPSCEGEDFKAFDFWVGEWDVYPNADGSPYKVADSSIEKVSAGCAIRETWMPLQGRSGTSLSAYDPATEGWHQLWVGGQPGRVFFDGGAVEGKMILTGQWGKAQDGTPLLVRMTYSLRDDGSVRQHGEASKDRGLSWANYFDLIYRRKDAAE
ncbi:hypothetical protein [Qipengyuania aquimaris]|uniref:hypothetical protein n=1 Tax=Qipengyuania aquimaris TaxID=255984 RepID=UPI001FD60573|nr:hypothetical protein [Qipengyuania aquimaris]UOR14725.1 hypothetical protein LCM05_09520 [Qipengyuania aquimaris]